MTQTVSSDFAGLVSFDIQERVLENLRTNLLYANQAWSQEGQLMKGTDTARFVFIPDLSVSTTPMTEGTTPTAVGLSETHVDVSAAQYGNLVDISDVARLKSPVDLAAEASERLARNAQEVIDQITRDTIAASGTAFIGGAGTHTTRATLDWGDTLTGANLRKLYFTMRKNKVPTFPDSTYILILGSDQAYDLKADTTATSGPLAVLQYTTPRAAIEGEIAAFEGFRIVVSNNPPSVSSTVDVEQGIAFGPLKGWGRTDLQSLEAKFVAPGGDHTDPLGLSTQLGWKVMFGVAALANSRYYRLESAFTAL